MPNSAKFMYGKLASVITVFSYSLFSCFFKDPYAHHRSDRRYNSQGSGVRKRTGGFFASPTMTFKFPTIRFLLLFLFLHLAATAETNSQFKKVADGSSVGDYANTEPVENNNHTAVTMMMRINDSLSIGELPRSERKTRLRGERLRGERIRNDLKGPGLGEKWKNTLLDVIERSNLDLNRLEFREKCNAENHSSLAHFV